MKISNPKGIQKKDLIVFDLDGTLSETKAVMDKDMSGLINQLLEKKQVAVIGGGKYGIFKTQLIAALTTPRELLKKLYLFPATSTAFYRYNKGWKNVYEHLLPKAERIKIKKTFEQVLKDINYVHPKKTYGVVIEDRGTQVTFSALGQEVVAMLGKKKGVAMKNKWGHENRALKMKIAKEMAKRLPHLEVHAAGHTSIDITKKGIDKSYGVKQITKYLKVPVSKMIFVGDAIFPGGNDYAALKTGIDYVKVSGPEETKKFIRMIL